MNDVTYSLDRRAFIQRLVDDLPDLLIVAGLGSPSYDVFAAGDRDTNFYLWGAMGGAVPTGLGLAIAQPDRQVLVVTGDGEMLMGVGALGTVAVKAPSNLTIVVLDNGHYGETGMQRSHAGMGTDLAAVAAAFGVPNTTTIDTLEAADDVAIMIKYGQGPSFARVLVATGDFERALPARDGNYLKSRFRAALGYATI